MGGRIRPAIPRLPLARASRRLAGLTRKPEPGDTLCEMGCGASANPYGPVGKFDTAGSMAGMTFPPVSHAHPPPAEPVQRGMRVPCMQSLKDPAVVQVPHVVERMLSESNLAGPDTQLRTAD